MINICVVGNLPPPMGGAAKNTKIVADELSKYSNVTEINTSVGLSHSRGLSYHINRLKKTFLCCIHLFKSLNKNKENRLYIVPDGGLGIIYTFLYISVGYMFVDRIYMHHRTFLYIDNKNVVLNFIHLLFLKKIQHIFLSEKMKESYFKHYKDNSKTSFVSDNSRFVTPREVSKNSKKINIGHLSNLCDDKGFYEVIEVFTQLKKSDKQYHFYLAGEPVNATVAKDLEVLLDEMGESISYLGFVDGESKETFYEHLDIFLFPTKFKQEAQPNVIYEAQSKLAYCVSWSRACIPEMVTTNSGYIIEQSDNFVENSLRHISELTKEELVKKRTYIYKEIVDRKTISQKQFYNLVEEIVGRL